MAASREKRGNAGNRLSKLLNDEEEDDFYKTTYGGFNDLENDDDYQSEAEGEDIVDSDFSIDENDEVISDTENADEDKPKRKSVYKDPKASKPTTSKKVEKVNRVKTVEKRKPIKDTSSLDKSLFERKSIRKSTVVKSAETLRRLKERTASKRRSAKRGKYYHMTQEERLEEAKITEIENIKSLRQFQELELEKKKVRNVKKTFSGPTIKYISTTTPEITTVKPDKASESGCIENIIIDESAEPEVIVTGRQSRTFITFSDHPTFRKAFPIHKRSIVKSKKRCPITKMVAKYVDPITELPFYNGNAFRCIREGYYHHLDQKGNKFDPQVTAWLEWYKNNKKMQKDSLAVYSETSVLNALRQLPSLSQFQLNTSTKEN
ncbi:vacuolar protein sorting-associated protein 72 homolog [Planococcus citri]|uniref:vacuolar protein sorting-associated protein 72 homolog n=1 Tax=Planococcus citri TaxID=170843 RepID=UPI0031F8F256